MLNIYQPQPAKIISSTPESADTQLLRLQFVDKKLQADFSFLPGQFVQVGLPQWGECPISICSSSHYSGHYFELAIRNVGALTDKLNSLREGDVVYIRGPYGNGFDVEKFRDLPLLLIGGGCGFVPLRSLIIDYVEERLPNAVLKIFYGCKDENTLLFKKEYAKWNRQAELNVILEKPSKQWAGAKGMITDLLASKKITANSLAVLVGPPIMYRFVIKELKKKGIQDENIYLSLERKMYCGLGVCQHCAIGPFYVCKDGPVFTYADLKNIPGAI